MKKEIKERTGEREREQARSGKPKKIRPKSNEEK